MIDVKNDITIGIATGRSRKEIIWKNKKTTWAKFVNRISETHRTYEKYVEYINMSKDEQANIKDVGGFVGGFLKEGKRSNGYVLNRQLITLDIDYGRNDTWSDIIKVLPDIAIVMYSTHKHSPTTPRYRVIMPIDRPVSAEQYEAIARKIAEKIGIEIFDDTTYQPTRLMFWPSTSKDQEYIFEYQDGAPIDSIEVLDEYQDWTDVSFWPTSSRESALVKKILKKQQDPYEKDGYVGAFCRAYTIGGAINTFLSDVYEEAPHGRYTYKGGSTAAGVVVYDDKFAYSNHSTDPISKQLVNSFDLVRINLFRDLDNDIKQGTPINRMPSWKAMIDLCKKDDKTSKKLSQERFEEALKEFDSDDNKNAMSEEFKASMEFLKNLERYDNGPNMGKIVPSIDNFVMILEQDPNLGGLGGLNMFTSRYEVKHELPWSRAKSGWSDEDSSNLRHYVEFHYKCMHRGNLEDAISVVFNSHQFHPIKEYLDSLVWDSKERVETLLIDYLGCNNSQYIREITRKTLAAAVARIYEPGCKFDQILTLVGPQGLGKSTLFNILAGSYFSDTLPDVKGKEAYEALDGVWIMEIPELGAFKKADREQIKSFISKRKDTYRKAYGRYTTDNPRQCIFIGTTNDVAFLDDSTGGRRFWIADCSSSAISSMWDDLDSKEVDQIWAEAKEIYMSGENIMVLSDEVEKDALDLQESHSQDSAMVGLIENYLETKIPANWLNLTIEEQRQWYQATQEYRDSSEETLKERDKICALEIWCVLLEKNKADLNKGTSKYINECIAKIPNWKRVEVPLKYGTYGSQRIYRKELILSNNI